MTNCAKNRAYNAFKMVAVAQLVEQRIVVPLVTSSNLVSHPILKKSAETKSVKTTFPRFFCAHFAPPQPRIYKAPAPDPNKLPILKSESHSWKPPAFRTHKNRKNRRILEKSHESLGSGNSSSLKYNPQTVYPQNPNSFFHISEKSNSDCSDGGNCIRFIILETLKREIPVIREICE